MFYLYYRAKTKKLLLQKQEKFSAPEKKLPNGTDETSVHPDRGLMFTVQDSEREVRLDLKSSKILKWFRKFIAWLKGKFLGS